MHSLPLLRLPRIPCKAACGLALLTGLGLISAPAAHAQTEWTVASGGNGHSYQVVSGTIHWSDAEAQAAGMTYQGQSGYLATITSAAEDNFIVANLSLTSLPWIGGYQPVGSSEPDGGWSWITGETWSYTDWHAGEPNNSGGIEDRLQIYTDGTWNDAESRDATGTTSGFLVEFNAPAPVPEASSIVSLGLLLLLGAGGIVMSRRRKAKSTMG